MRGKNSLYNMIQSELLNLLYNKNTDKTSVVSKGPVPRSILDAWPQSMRT